MTTSKWFEDLEVWQSAKELTNLIHRLSGSGSFARNLGLRDQMRSSATAIMSNIADGFESQTQVLFLRFLASAKSAAAELRAKLYVALEQQFMTREEFEAALFRTESCNQQLVRFMEYLESQSNSRRGREENTLYDAQA